MTLLSDEDRLLFEAAVDQFAQRGGARAVREKGDLGVQGRASAGRPPGSRRRKGAQPIPVDTLDLHGEHLDQALTRLDRFVTAAPSGSWVRVVHGHGTGTLARACRRELSRDSRVAEVREPTGSGSRRAELWVRRR